MKKIKGLQTQASPPLDSPSKL